MNDLIQDKIQAELDNLYLTPSEILSRFDAFDYEEVIIAERDQKLTPPYLKIIALAISNKMLSNQEFDRYLTFLDKYNSYIQTNTEQINNTIISVSSFMKHIWFLAPTFRDILLLENRLESLFSKGEIARESVLQSILYTNFNQWENCVAASKEVKMNFGKCDLFLAIGKEKLPIELKKRNLLAKDVYQSYEYVRGKTTSILIGRKSTQDFTDLAMRLNVSIYNILYAYPENDESRYPCGIYLEHESGTPINQSFDKLLKEMQASILFEIPYGIEITELLASNIIGQYENIEKMVEDFIEKYRREKEAV